MDLKEKESLINKQERAARQQELLEKKRRARAEYNTSPARSEKKTPGRESEDRKKQKKEINRKIFSRRISTDSVKKAVPEKSREETVSVSQWFLSICWLKIPIVGVFYALILALSRRAPEEKRNFARGYILYRVLVFLLSLTVLYAVYRLGLGFVEELLSYVKG